MPGLSTGCKVKAQGAKIRIAADETRGICVMCNTTLKELNADNSFKENFFSLCVAAPAFNLNRALIGIRVVH
jgi:hypothetical protein